MSACLALDDALPTLTSRLLLLLEDEEDMLVINRRSLPAASCSIAVTRNVEESKEPEEVPVLASPCHQLQRKGSHQVSPNWSSPRLTFDSIPESGLPSIPPLPNPSTPLSTKGLFVSFSSSPMQQDLWQYGEATAQYQSFLSPRTTEAICEESKKGAVEAGWCKNNSSNNKKGGTATYVVPPMPPSLLQNLDVDSSHSNAPPSVIRYRNRSGSYSSLSGFEDDEVSLLADDPDEDDVGVLPPATYDVVVNILDEIDRDEDKI